MALYVTATFLAETYSTTWPSLSTTVNGTVNVGSATSDKIIVACIGSIPRSTGVTSTLTVDGVSATLYAATNYDDRSMAFAVVALPSSSGTVNFTLTSTQNIFDTVIHWYDVRNADITSVRSGVDTPVLGGDYLQVNLDAKAHGVVFGLDISFSWPNPDVFTVSDQAWTPELYNNDHSEGLTVYSGYTYPSADDTTYLVEMDKVFGTAVLLGALSLAPLSPAYIVADIGSYQLTGTDATPTRAGGAPHYLVIAEAWEPPELLLRSLQLPAQTHTYELTGTDAYITRSEGGAARREFAIASFRSGVFINETTTGREYGVYGTYLNESAPLPSGVILAAEAGSYELTGTAATATHAGVSGAGGDYFGNRYFGARYFGDRYWGIGGAGAAALSIAADAGSYALTGTAATPKHGWKVAAGAGSYTLTGTAATPKHGWKIAALAGSYALTGTAAPTLHRWKVIATTVGSYTLTGQPATPTKIARYTITADVGSYTLSGTAASTLHRWKVIATTVGAYALTGTAATLTKGKRLVALVGSYALVGTAATPVHRWKVTATTVGAYTLAGTAAGTYRGRKAIALAGSYTLTGQTATIKFGRSIEGEAGSYVLTGTDVFLDFSAFVPIPVAGLRVVYADDESRVVEAIFAGAVPRIVHATPPRIART